MEQVICRTYREKRQFYRGKDLLFHTVAYHVAPVLEKIKPAALLVFTNGKQNMASLWRNYRCELMRKTPLEFFQLNTSSRSFIVLFYHPDTLG